MDIVDFTLIPHLDSGNRQSALEQFSGDGETSVYALRDDSAISIDGSRQLGIGSEPLIIKK
jgi:hypothetical protein